MDIPSYKVIEDIVAQDDWAFVDETGREQIARVRVGRPRPWTDGPHGDWLCPVQIDGFTEGIHSAVGVGPVDALLNATKLVNAFADEIGSYTPRAQRERS